MSVPYTHLHVHSEYSLLDGACRIRPLVQEAARQGLPALALTDHGTLYGAVPFYEQCREHGVKPILGVEAYWTSGSRLQRSGRADAHLCHLTLLAENEVGYRNLTRLVTDSHLEGFYYKPRVDRELLAQCREGLIVLSGCLKGPVCDLLLQQRERDARQMAGDLCDLVGREQFFIELMDHDIPEQRQVMPHLLRIAQDLGVRTVATNDVHYLREADAVAHDVLLCIQTRTHVDDPERLRFHRPAFYLKTPEEMAALFGEHPDALRATLDIAERCRFDLQLGETLLPHFEAPGGQDLSDYLRALCRERLPARYPHGAADAEQRLDYELGVIKQKGLEGYFLIVWDFIRFAKERGILVGPGRGSAIGSIVAYLLGITNLDPLRYGLPFERFLNPERQSLPDIDCDFEDLRRDEVIQYVTERYGADHVAQIVSFGSIKARLAVRDAGRAMRVPLPEVDRIAKMIPQGPTLHESLTILPDLKQEYDRNPAVRTMLDTAMLIEGLPRQASTHAAGVVISRLPLATVVPLQRSPDGARVTTQYDMDAVKALGLLKMDFLGLRTLTVLKHCLALIEREEGVHLNLDELPLDDAKTFDMLSRGEAIGTFQLESEGMRRALRQLRPDSFEDLIALVALYRPGPMAEMDNFIACKHGRRRPQYAHPTLEPILRETHGIILYQEQVLRMAQDLAGLTAGRAELLRESMAKKKSALMEELRPEFIDGAVARGLPRGTAEDIFQRMSQFAAYAFNKAHSAGYALVAYQTAFLKAHHPAHYMAALLTSVMDDKDRVARYIDESRRLRIEVRPPCINRSGVVFEVQDGAVRFGLVAVKGVGRASVEAILQARPPEGFRDLFDLCAQVDPTALNRGVLEGLAKSGALDALGLHRGQTLALLDQALEVGHKMYRDREAGQSSLFGDGAAAAPDTLPAPPAIEPLPSDQILAMEKETLGVFVSDHPLNALRDDLARVATHTAAALEELDDVEEVTIAGLVLGLRQQMTKTQRLMAFFTLEDLTGSVEVTVFPDTFEQDRAALADGVVVAVRGRTEASPARQADDNPEGRDRSRVLASAIARLDDAGGVARVVATSGRPSRPRREGRNGRNGANGHGGARRGAAAAVAVAAPTTVRIRLAAADGTPQQLERLKGILLRHPGRCPVCLQMSGPAGPTTLELGDDYAVNPTAAFRQAVEELLGGGAVQTA